MESTHQAWGMVMETESAASGTAMSTEMGSVKALAGGSISVLRTELRMYTFA